ncbi:MAG: hypothetical protein ACTH3P_06825 [Proteus vulgaris]|nr:hypothetical protein [Proteus mirabilis]
MATIKVIERSSYSQRRYERRADFLARKREEIKTPSRSVEEIWDSIIKPVDETDVLASLVLSLKSAPDTRKTLKLKKQPSSEFGVTAR